MRNKVCLTYIVSMAAFDQICCRRTVSVHGSKSRRTQKEKMETHLYSLTRFLCLCSRELAMVLNYYAVCKKVCGKLGQSSSQEHSHSDCDTALIAALETSM